MIPRHAILSRFSTLCCFLGGEHTLFAPWAYGGHDLSWENGWQIGQTLPQPIHERRGKMDDRFWSQGHLPTGQSGDPWILQKGLYFGYFFFFSKCAHDSNLDFRDKAKMHKTEDFLWKTRVSWMRTLFRPAQGKKRIIEAKNRNQRMRTRSLSLPAVSQIPFVQSQFYCCLAEMVLHDFSSFPIQYYFACIASHLSRRDFHSISSLIYHLQKECKNKWKSDLLHSTFCASR